MDASFFAEDVRICMTDAAEVLVFVTSVSCGAQTLPTARTGTTDYSLGDSAATSTTAAAATVPVSVPLAAGRTATDVATIWRETVHN